ncbi:hypothetical protein JTB14_023246 [Gonioctena quinquepunctata]|nr:hypothetical protein JTB14_023246 [Gonioctena quinquepunctata]
MKTESEMENLIQEQKSIIQELEKQIHKLQDKKADENRETNDISTQTHTLMHSKGTVTEMDLKEIVENNCTSNKNNNRTQVNYPHFGSTEKHETDMGQQTTLKKNRNNPNQQIDSNPPPKLKRNKLTIISNKHGRDMARIMGQQTDDYVIHSIIKPNTNNYELYHTAVQEANCASKNDIIIFWDKH